MKTLKVEVLPYEYNWAKQFLLIKDEVMAAMGTTAIGIEHVGSTAVWGLYAKPTIDIDVIIRDRNHLPEAIAKLEAAGYIHEGDLGIKDREAFCYHNKYHLMKHHLYVCPMDSPELKRHIAFRDYLRDNKQARDAYGKIKLEATKLFPSDIDGYINYKSPFIEELYQTIGL